MKNKFNFNTNQNPVILDASKNPIVGKLANKIAFIIMGKTNSNYMPNKISGNPVIIKNVNQIQMTGTKVFNKKMYKHTSYIGNLKIRTPNDFFKSNNHKYILLKAVTGMLPKTKLFQTQINKYLKFE